MFSLEALKDIVVKHLKGLADNQWNSSSMSFGVLHGEWKSERETIQNSNSLIYAIQSYIYKQTHVIIWHMVWK